MRRSLTFFGPPNIEKLTRKLMFSGFVRPDGVKIRRESILELFPTIPTYQNPIIINPGQPFM